MLAKTPTKAILYRYMREEQPHKVFGLHLKQLREKAKESLLEVSSAVEIDPYVLEAIESGRRLPEEDILMLLISHFDIPDNESVRLWELAGYGQNRAKDVSAEEQILKQVMMVIPFDNRVAFVDSAQIDANDNGVVINFTLGDTPQIVSRVGMSLKTAQELVEKLSGRLQLTNQPKVIRMIPAQNTNKKTDKKNPNII